MPVRPRRRCGGRRRTQKEMLLKLETFSPDRRTLIQITFKPFVAQRAGGTCVHDMYHHHDEGVAIIIFQRLGLMRDIVVIVSLLVQFAFCFMRVVGR